MAEKTDEIRKQIAERRERLESNIRTLEARMRSATWKSLAALAFAFGGGLLLSRRSRR